MENFQENLKKYNQILKQKEVYKYNTGAQRSFQIIQKIEEEI